MTIALDPTSGNKRPRPAQYLTRTAACYARAHVNGGSPERIARDLFDDRVTRLVVRAATTQATITDPTWAGAVGQQVVSDLVAAATTIRACPSPKPCPACSADVRALLTRPKAVEFE
jgi:hypothetical protein